MKKKDLDRVKDVKELIMLLDREFDPDVPEGMHLLAFPKLKDEPDYFDVALWRKLVFEDGYDLRWFLLVLADIFPHRLGYLNEFLWEEDFMHPKSELQKKMNMEWAFKELIKINLIFGRKVVGLQEAYPQEKDPQSEEVKWN